MLAFRRQHHQEIATLLTDQDAAQRRITELYTKAVEQLGSDKAPVRLGGLYALERLGQDNPSQRQTIVNVICAYLRMPFPATPDSTTPRPPDGNPASANTEPTITPGLADNTWQYPKRGHNTARALLRFACRQIDQLAHGRGWEAEYPRDIWRLRNLGICDGPTARLHFDRIPQPWLRDLVKRWTRWRLATSLSAGTAGRGVRALARFGALLASAAIGVTGISQVDRAVLERYLADLHAGLAGAKVHREHIGQLSAFLQAIRQHRWDDRLPATAMTRWWPRSGTRSWMRQPRPRWRCWPWSPGRTWSLPRAATGPTGGGGLPARSPGIA